MKWVVVYAWGFTTKITPGATPELRGIPKQNIEKCSE